MNISLIFFVQVRGAASALRQFTFGFPQGAHLCPQGFSYYIDEILEIAEKHGVCAHLYADDTQHYTYLSHSAKEVVCIMEDCISDVKKCMLQN